jgi:hypothetical protein
MFERVGRQQRGDRRRQGGAIAVSGALGVALLAGLLALGGGQAGPTEPVEDDGVGVMFEPLPGGGGGAPEPVRAAVPAQRAAPSAPARTPETPPRAEPPREVVPVVQQSAVVAGGTGGGGGVAPGPGDGPGAGPGQGPGPGGPGADPGVGPGDHAVTPAKVVIRRAPDFRYPEAAHALALGAVRCELRYLVDARGRPQRVDIVDCPEVFHREISLRAHKARFAPARVDGRAVPARFVLGVTFRPSR